MKVRNVVITGYGFVAPFGDTPAALDNVLSAGTEFRCCGDGPSDMESRRVPDELLKAHLEGRNLRQLDRTSQLLASAASIALQHSGLAGLDRAALEIGIVSGTMFSSAHTIAEFDCRAVTEGPRYASALDFANTVLNASVGQTAICHTLRDENSTIAAGMTSGLRAIASGFDSVRSGRATAVLAGGVEELSDELCCAFNDSQLLGDGAPGSSQPWGRNRNGISLSEGASLVVLEDEASALQRNANILGRVRGAGWSFDCNKRADAATSVESIRQALQIAADDAGFGNADLDCCVASANGSVREDQHESAAVARFFGDRLRDLTVMAPKAMTGESIGAAGAMQLIALLQSMHSGRAPRISSFEPSPDCDVGSRLASSNTERAVRNALINSVCFDGNSCSLVVSRHQCFCPTNN